MPALKERGLREYEPFRDDYGSETTVREKMYCFRHYAVVFFVHQFHQVHVQGAVQIFFEVLGKGYLFVGVFDEEHTPQPEEDVVPDLQKHLRLSLGNTFCEHDS